MEVKVQTDLADDVTAPERGRVILHRHAEVPESELVQRQVVLEPGRTRKGWREVRQESHNCRQTWRQSRSPLVVLGVMVSLLHCRFLFGGLVFVWQQQEGDVAVHAVFALGQ